MRVSSERGLPVLLCMLGGGVKIISLYLIPSLVCALAYGHHQLCPETWGLLTANAGATLLMDGVVLLVSIFLLVLDNLLSVLSEGVGLLCQISTLLLNLL